MTLFCESQRQPCDEVIYLPAHELPQRELLAFWGHLIPLILMLVERVMFQRSSGPKPSAFEVLEAGMLHVIISALFSHLS